MNKYHYVLIRYVPDRERMEPTNVGVILQGNRRLDMKFSQHAAKRSDIDTTAYRQWKDFFRTEVQGDPMPLFQPDKASPAFLRYLEPLCEGPVLLSKPLLLQTDPTRRFDEVLNSLYDRLVAPPEMASPTPASSPTGRFRQLAECCQFVDRGMKRHAHVKVDGKRLWMAYRQVLDGELIAFDKVEVANNIGQTSYEIERLPRIAHLLPDFIRGRAAGKATRYLLLADQLVEPFTGQPEDEFEAMRDDLEQAVEEVKKQGCTIIRITKEAEEFANELDERLPPKDAGHDLPSP